MQHHASFKRKTRGKLSKEFRTKGKISIRNYFQHFKNGDKVVLKAEPAIAKGMYYPRFHGKNALVIGKQGDCYQVLIKDGGKEKMIIVHPIHLMRS
jgi:large subunit ribosomal protein L21e